jgi:hypothetical protein
LEKRLFKYRRSIILTTDWGVVIIVLVIALGSWIIHTGEVTGGVLLILIGCGLFVPLYINAKLTLSPLCVDDDGITVTTFGCTWKSMKWRDVREVRSAQWTDVGYSKSTRKFVIYSTSGERFYLKKAGPIIFNETIIGFESLLDILREKSRLHGFTIAPLEG